MDWDNSNNILSFVVFLRFLLALLSWSCVLLVFVIIFSYYGKSNHHILEIYKFYVIHIIIHYLSLPFFKFYVFIFCESIFIFLMVIYSHLVLFVFVLYNYIHFFLFLYLFLPLCFFILTCFFFVWSFFVVFFRFLFCFVIIFVIS